MPSDLNAEALEDSLEEFRAHVAVDALLDSELDTPENCERIRNIFAAAEAHLATLSSATDELAEAKAELGAWLVANPGWTFALREGPGGAELTLYTDRAGYDDVTGRGADSAAAIRDALSKAKAAGGSDAR